MKAFTNPWLNKRLPVLICTFIFPLTVFLTGCYTTRTEIVDEEQLPQKKNYEIISLELHSGKTISMVDMKAKYLPVYMDKHNVIVYKTAQDTIQTSEGAEKIVYKNNVIELKDIKLVKIGISKYDPTLVLFIIGSTVMVLVILMFASSNKNI
jgi:hypothetical protein